MINFLLTKKQKSIKNYTNTILYQIYEQCIVNNTEQRPHSSKLVNDFIYFIRMYNININKFYYYYSLAANQNIPQTQFNHGVFYSEGQYISRDINKAIYYYSLAANQNDPKAQLNLGNIYYLGEYISRDINKAIHYYSLAADQNIPEAQLNLGNIYYLGGFFKMVNKKTFL